MCAMKRCFRDETGAVSTEFTVLVPFFVLFLVFFADATVIYLTHSEMFNVAREISRRVSTGELKNLSEVEAYAKANLFLGSREYFVAADFGGEKRATLVIGLYDAAIFGAFFRPILGKELVATAATGEEPRI